MPSKFPEAVYSWSRATTRSGKIATVYPNLSVSSQRNYEAECVES